MDPFQLHPRLKEDCHVIAESEISLLLLLDNAHLPWFLLVPKTEHKELYQLPDEMQQSLLHQINLVSAFVDVAFQPDKLNVAAIGNLVPQLHFHILARYKTDPCWPGVVWGALPSKSYQEKELNELKAICQTELSSCFSRFF